MLGRGPVRDTANVSEPAPVVRSQIVLPADVPMPLGTGVQIDPPQIVLSPDGKLLLFIGTTGDVTRLYLRDLASFDDPRPIAGTEDVQHATFSPDGRTVAFVTRSQLKRVGIEGDDLRTLCDTSNALRVDWTADGWIWFGENESLVVCRIRETGGQPETVTRLTDQVFSEVLPDGRAALVTSRGSHVSVDYEEVGLLDLETLEVRPLIASGYDPRYLDSGHLLFARGGNLLAVAFDAERGRVTGEPATVVRGVAMDSFFGHVQVDVSRNGWDGFAGEPIWCGNCDEIFFRTPRGWMATRFSFEDGLSWDTPQLAFTTDLLDTNGRSYDVSSDGQRLFIVQSDRPFVRDRIHLITNFGAELERLLAGR